MSILNIMILEFSIKAYFSCLWTNFNNFFLTWKFDGDSKSDILNFVFMNVVILVLIIFTIKMRIFCPGIVGVQLWAGLLRQRCYIDEIYQTKKLQKPFFNE